MEDWRADKTASTLLVWFIPSHDRFEAPIANQGLWVTEALRVLGETLGGATAFPQGRGVWRSEGEPKMAKNIDRLAKAFGAEIVGQVPEYSGGAFGAAKLAQLLRARLSPSQGRRPGRPTNPEWKRRPKVPMSPETEHLLEELARMVSDESRQVSPMQVAAQILEEATRSYFQRTRDEKRKRAGFATA